jgi:anti-sigma regulatory factor (Ser/Thr protein kinase)
VSDDGEWLMVLHLEHERRSVSYARRWVLRQAAEAGFRGETRAAVELLTSELVANALSHGPETGTITVTTDDTNGLFEVTVTDESAEMPVLKRPEPLAEGGRGVMLVDMLADSWGTRLLQDGGKAVWFTVPI